MDSLVLISPAERGDTNGRCEGGDGAETGGVGWVGGGGYQPEKNL